MAGPDAALLDRFGRREATIGVIGLGYIGLPLAKAFCAAGFRVIGFDIDPEKSRKLRAGTSYIQHVGLGDLPAALAAGRFVPTADFGLLPEADAVVICVPTPLNRHREPDLSAVISTTRTIAAHLRPGQLVVLESTTYPGTTTDVVLPLLQETGLASGSDFFVAFSPEREDPGNAQFDTTTIPKVVGADDDAALRLAVALYGAIVRSVVPVSSLRAAEAVKITENIFRAVNIALVNELKVIYAAMDISVWEVIEAAKTKPFGYMPFYPGPGLGGHCIPIDPFYLTWKAREFGLHTKFIELAGEINTSMPRYVVGRLSDELNRRFRKSLNGSRILMIGLSYKRDIDDVRESPAFAVLEMLEAAGAEVAFFDPHVSVIPPTREHAPLTGRRSVTLSPETTGTYDAAVIVTDHTRVDYPALVEASRLVVDTRGVLRRLGLAPRSNVAEA
ncbi:nucleotide sugar dehydrogenase [Muricoccus radiodurans]|uniref:nucleotide sugar dehydrogenase n=1 Tax=Muricoccus radiodurans TaxID=2231721 RepID=UPI003CF7AE64